VAFSDGDMGDLEYRAVWEYCLLPIAKQYDPELIIISAGFDAAEGDPIGKYHVSPKCFGKMIWDIGQCNKTSKIILLLEGGYNLSTTAESFCECTRALLNRDDESSTTSKWPEFTKWSKVKIQAIDAINITIATQTQYWPILKPVSYDDICQIKPYNDNTSKN
jgi:histone deacetylase 6